MLAEEHTVVEAEEPERDSEQAEAEEGEWVRSRSHLLQLSVLRAAPVRRKELIENEKERQVCAAGRVPRR